MLKLTFEPDQDDPACEKLTVVAVVDRFEGRASTYLSVSTITDDLSNPMTQYPLDQDRLPRLQGGVWHGEGAARVPEHDVLMIISPTGNKGRLKVEIELAEGSDLDRYRGPRQSMKVQFVTTYGALAAFAEQVRSMMNGNRDSARLDDDGFG